MLFTKNSGLISKESTLDLNMFYACFVCNKYYLNKLNLFSHYDTKEHRNRISCFYYVLKNKSYKISLVNNVYLIECIMCNVSYDRISIAVTHLSNQQHLNNLSNDKNNVSIQIKLENTANFLKGNNNKPLNQAVALSNSASFISKIYI